MKSNGQWIPKQSLMATRSIYSILVLNLFNHTVHSLAVYSCGYGKVFNYSIVQNYIKITAFIKDSWIILNQQLFFSQLNPKIQQWFSGLKVTLEWLQLNHDNVMWADLDSHWDGKFEIIWAANCLALRVDFVHYPCKDPLQWILYITLRPSLSSVDISSSKWHKVSMLKHHLYQWILVNGTCLWIQYGVMAAREVEPCKETGIAVFFPPPL